MSTLSRALKTVYNPVEENIVKPVQQVAGILTGGFERATGPIKPEEAAFAPQPYQAEMKRSEGKLGQVGKEYFLPGSTKKMKVASKMGGAFGNLGMGGDLDTFKYIDVPAPRTFQDMLAEQMTGQAPSIAEAQMKQALERSLASQRAGLAQTRGVSPALAQTLMARQAGTMGADIAQQAGIARLQEQRAAQEMFAGEMARQDAMKRFYEAQRSGNFAAMQQAQQDLESLKVGAKTESRRIVSEFISKLGAATMAGGNR